MFTHIKTHQNERSGLYCIWTPRLFIYIISIFVITVIVLSCNSSRELEEKDRLNRQIERMSDIRELIFFYHHLNNRYPSNGFPVGNADVMWNDLMTSELIEVSLQDYYSEDGKFQYYNFDEIYGDGIRLSGKVDFKGKLENVHWILISPGQNRLFDFNLEKRKVFGTDFPETTTLLNMGGDIYFTELGKLERYGQSSLPDKYWR